MTESELDSVYSELCRRLTGAGESGALVFLARFALLAIEKIDNADVATALLSAATTAGAADRPAEPASATQP